MGVVKVSVIQAKSAGFFVHLMDKDLLGTCQRLSDRNSAVIGRYGSNPLDQFNEFDFVPNFEKHLGSAHLPGLFTHNHLLVKFCIPALDGIEG